MIIKEPVELGTCCLCGKKFDLADEQLWIGGVPVCQEHVNTDEAALLSNTPERARQMILWRQEVLLTAAESEHLQRLLSAQWLPIDFEWGPVFAKLKWQAEVDQELHARLGSAEEPAEVRQRTQAPPAELD